MDVLCLGTTYETLSVLIHALQGLDYKLRIILNKADSFINMYDFARCYGTLCWNLAKVIHRKDLPPIYTMCVYPSARHLGHGSASGTGSKQGAVSPLALPSPVAAPNSGCIPAAPAPLASAIQDLLTTRYCAILCCSVIMCAQIGILCVHKD